MVRQTIRHVSGNRLLVTDPQNSPLRAVGSGDLAAVAYCAYGHRVDGEGLSGLPGFNGERADPLTGHYLLGNGYRAFSPVLMRFNSPDSWSPFGGGGLNAYAYCAGDPVNRSDPTGHMFRAGRWSVVEPFYPKVTFSKTIPGVRNVWSPEATPAWATADGRRKVWSRYGGHELSLESSAEDTLFVNGGWEGKSVPRRIRKKMAGRYDKEARKMLEKTHVDEEGDELVIGLERSTARKIVNTSKAQGTREGWMNFIEHAVRMRQAAAGIRSLASQARHLEHMRAFQSPNSYKDPIASYLIRNRRFIDPNYHDGS